MKELREEIAEILRKIPINTLRWERSQEDLKTEIEWADQILSLINKPITIDLPCDKCGGKGHTSKRPEGYHGDRLLWNCTCDNGKIPHVVVWEFEHSRPYGDEQRVASPVMVQGKLTLPDLRDPDVAMAYVMIHTHIEQGVGNDAEIPNNKGTLRLERRSDG